LFQEHGTCNRFSVGVGSHNSSHKPFQSKLSNFKFFCDKPNQVPNLCWLKSKSSHMISMNCLLESISIQKS